MRAWDEIASGTIKRSEKRKGNYTPALASFTFYLYSEAGPESEEQMTEQNFEAFISKERERLNKQREEIRAKQEQLQSQLDDIERELQAIQAYEDARTGRKKGRRGGRRRGRRAELLSLLKGSKGMTRGEILASLGLKGDKSGEQSVSNALSALVKTKQLKRAADGRYMAA